MDIAKYRKYVRDTSISDEDFEDLIKDVIEDIARDTGIFTDIFVFQLEGCIELYDIETLYDLSNQINEDNIVDITITDNINDKDSLAQYLNRLEIVTVDGTTCSTNDSSTTDTKVTTSQGDTGKKLLSVVDMIWSRDSLDDSLKYPSKEEVISVINSWFYHIGNFNYKKNNRELNRLFGYTDDQLYEIPIVTLVNYVPNLDQLDEDVERQIKTAIINGVKYYASDLYLNTVNEQTSNILYQRYYSSKKQLKFNYNNNLGKYSMRNAYWNI